MRPIYFCIYSENFTCYAFLFGLGRLRYIIWITCCKSKAIRVNPKYGSKAAFHADFVQVSELVC